MPTTRHAGFGLALVATLGVIATSTATAQGVEAPRVPLRTAVSEINALRTEYADLYNKKDTGALTALYLPDAVVIQGDGSTVMGRDAIGESLAKESADWKPVTISSDTMRIFGNTAWEVGTMRNRGGDNDAGASHYLVVLRRGLQAWKISSVAVVPEGRSSATK